MKWILKQLNNAWNWLMTRSQERWFYLCLGLVIGAFAQIVWNIDFAGALPIAVGFIIEFIRQWRTQEFRWKNFVCMALGGVIIFLIHLL